MGGDGANRLIRERSRPWRAEPRRSDGLRLITAGTRSFAARATCWSRSTGSKTDPGVPTRHTERRLQGWTSRQHADAAKHAAHRPPAEPPTSFGNFYPRGDIIAPVVEYTTAETVAQDLRSHGFPDGDIDVVDSSFALRASEELERRRGILGRLGAIFGDEHAFAEEFAELARAGYAFVIIHAPDDDALQRARAILDAHDIHGARHYGRYLMTSI